MAGFGVDFSPLGDLYNTYNRARTEKQSQDWLQQQGLPGNLNLAQLALQQQAVQRGEARDTRDFGFRQQQATQQQQNADRSFGFQKQQAEAAARGFELRELDDGMGGKKLVRVEKATGRAVDVPVEGGAPATPNNPFMTGGKMNEAQSKDALYASRMLAAEKELRQVESAGQSWWERLKGKASDKTGYNVRGPEFQKFDQAQRDFINATLRRESGAVIAESEFENANKQYFPQPGDEPATLEQKRRNRIEAIKGIGAGAGSGWRPSMTIDPSGNVVDNPKPQPRAAAPAAGDPLAEARAAIAKGAPRDAVMKRLQDNGINPAGL